MTAAAIVSKVWSYCNVLRDDGVGYGDYLEQIIDQSLQQAEALRQSILNKAFLKVDWLPQMHSPPRRGRGWVIN